MGRKYITSFENVSVAAAQDLITFQNNSGFARVLRFWVQCVDATLPPAQQLRLLGHVFTVNYTIGSGGTATGPKAVDHADAGTMATCHQNDTTVAVVGMGTVGVQIPLGMYIFQGMDYVCSEPVPLGNGDAFCFSLLAAPPGGSVKLSGGVLFEEIG